MIGRPPRPLAERFWAKVEKTDECWLWLGGCDRNGYGSCWDNAAQDSRPAHRIAWELVNGPVPEGLVLDHLCRNRACVNPAHLEPVTATENVRRGLGGVLHTHCPHGHEFTPENTYVYGRHRWRMCRICKVRRDRETQRRRRGGWNGRGKFATHCPQGHAYDEHGRRGPDGRLYCRVCKTEKSRVRRNPD